MERASETDFFFSEQSLIFGETRFLFFFVFLFHFTPRLLLSRLRSGPWGVRTGGGDEGGGGGRWWVGGFNNATQIAVQFAAQRAATPGSNYLACSSFFGGRQWMLPLRES